MNDQMRTLKKWIYLRFQRCRGGAEAWVECWKRSRSSLEETPHAEGRENKKNKKQVIAWKLEDLRIEREIKLMACEWAEGKESERSNRLTGGVTRCCLEKRHPVSCCSHHFTAFESSLELGEICSWEPVSPQRSPRMCVGQFSAFCFSYVPALLRNKYSW